MTQNGRRGNGGKYMRYSYLHTVPVGMDIKSSLYPALECSVLARLSARTDWISCKNLPQFPRRPCCVLFYICTYTSSSISHVIKFLQVLITINLYFKQMDREAKILRCFYTSYSLLTRYIYVPLPQRRNTGCGFFGVKRHVYL